MVQWCLLSCLLLASSVWAQQKVRVGIYQNSPKVAFTNSAQPQGIYIDVIEAIAQKEGWQLEYVPGTWAEGVGRLERGEIDLMPDLTRSVEREQIFAFHQESVLASWNQIYARRGSGVRSVLDLDGKSVAVLNGSIQQTLFAEMIASFNLNTTAVPFAEYSDAFNAVINGQVDAVITNRFYGVRNAGGFGLEDTAIIFSPSLEYYGAPKVGRQALLTAIDNNLSVFKKNSDSIYYRSLRRWTIDEVRAATPSWLVPVLTAVAVTLLAGVMWVVLLRRQVAARTREIRQRSEEVLLINRTLRATGSRRELGAVLDEATKGALALTGFDGGVLCIRDEHSGLLHVGARVGSVAETDRTFDDKLLCDAVCPAMLERLNPLQRHVLVASDARDAVVRWHAYFPLEVQGRNVGVLCLFSQQAGAPPVRTMKLVEDICSPVALAIENARLYAQAKEHAHELENRVALRTEELAQANTELLDSKHRAESADRIKTAFMATMSHELRTPLNSIIGFTGIVLQGLAGPLNAEQGKQLGMVRDSARHLLALINDVLDISKIEAGALTVGRERFDLVKSIEKVAGIVKPLAEKKGLTLSVQVAAGVSHMVSDARRVEQILFNLLGNAIKFTESGSVTLQAVPVDDFQPNPQNPPCAAVQLSVADTGMGIKPEDMSLLFMPFRQIDSALSRKHDGTGLGLAICRRLAARMGGRIHARSQWGQGSVFTVILPVQAQPDPQAS